MLKVNHANILSVRIFPSEGKRTRIHCLRLNEWFQTGVSGEKKKNNTHTKNPTISCMKLKGWGKRIIDLHFQSVILCLYQKMDNFRQQQTAKKNSQKVKQCCHSHQGFMGSWSQKEREFGILTPSESSVSPRPLLPRTARVYRRDKEQVP